MKGLMYDLSPFSCFPLLQIHVYSFLTHMPASIPNNTNSSITDESRKSQYRIAVVIVLGIIAFIALSSNKQSTGNVTSTNAIGVEVSKQDTAELPIPLLPPSQQLINPKSPKPQQDAVDVHHGVTIGKRWRKRNGPLVVDNEDSKRDIRRSLLEDHAKQCSKLEASRESTKRTTSFEVLHAGGTIDHPSWQRFWIRGVVDESGTPQCSPNARVYYQIRIQSTDVKIAVDRQVDLQNGITEVVFFLRTSGTYEICIDFTHSVIKSDGPLFDSIMVFDNHTLSGDYFITQKFPGPKEMKAGSAPACAGKGDWDVKCSNYSYTVRHPRNRQGLPSCKGWRDFTSSGGEWRRLESNACDGNLCTGDLPVMNSEGWLWVPDACVVHIFSSKEAWQLYDKKWIVGWGGSTMKQPMSNMLEYLLKVPVFNWFMEHLESARRRAKGKHAQKMVPGFFSYRQWDVTKKNPFGNEAARFSMIWGGCVGITAYPGCPIVGMTNRHVLEKYITTSSAPDVIFMNHYLWRYDNMNVKEFLNQMRDVFRYVFTKYESVGRRPPLVIWNTMPHPAHNEFHRCHYPTVNVPMHYSWAMEDLLHQRQAEKESPTLLSSTYTKDDGEKKSLDLDIVLIPRFHISMPFHFGDDYIQMGVHYGATKGMCATGLSYKDVYQFSRCVKKTFVDDMIVHLWMNALSNRSSGSR